MECESNKQQMHHAGFKPVWIKVTYFIARPTNHSITTTLHSFMCRNILFYINFNIEKPEPLNLMLRER